MSKCKNNGCENTDLVHSGVDTVMYDIHFAPTGTYCYRCAAAYAMISRDREEALQKLDSN